MKFNQRFTNIEIDAHEARKRFVNRMLYVVFSRYPAPQGTELQLVSRALGETLNKIEHVENIFRSDFCRLLDMLERLVEILPEEVKDANNGLTASKLVNQIQHELNAADIDIEVEWRDGRFFPRGAKLLDQKLVDDPLEWLNNLGYTNVLQPFRKSLEHFLHSKKNPELLSDSITDAFDALESMAKEVCGNNRTFDANREQFISKIKTSREFRTISKELTQYAHSFRHGASGSNPKPNPSQEEVEAYIYSVGILIRVASKSVSEKDPLDREQTYG